MKSLRRQVFFMVAIFLVQILQTLPLAAGVRSVIVAVDGMSCPFCAFGVEKRLKKVSGVKSVTVNLRDGKARLGPFRGKTIRVSEVPQAIRQAGFTPGSIEVVITGYVRMGTGGQWVLEDDLSKEVYRLNDPGEPLKNRLDQFSKSGRVQITGVFYPAEEGVLPAITPERIREGGT